MFNTLHIPMLVGQCRDAPKPMEYFCCSAARLLTPFYIFLFPKAAAAAPAGGFGVVADTWQIAMLRFWWVQRWGGDSEKMVVWAWRISAKTHWPCWYLRHPSGELGSFPPPTITAGCQPPWIWSDTHRRMQQNCATATGTFPTWVPGLGVRPKKITF